MNCYSCHFLMRLDQTADGQKRCRIDGLMVSPALEADCKRYLREVGADDEVPPWYLDAWNISVD